MLHVFLSLEKKTFETSSINDHFLQGMLIYPDLLSESSIGHK